MHLFHFWSQQNRTNDYAVLFPWNSKMISFDVVLLFTSKCLWNWNDNWFSLDEEWIWCILPVDCVIILPIETSEMHKLIINTVNLVWCRDFVLGLFFCLIFGFWSLFHRRRSRTSFPRLCLYGGYRKKFKHLFI